MSAALLIAAKQRARAAREDESGFVLIYTMLVIAVVTILVGSVLVVTAGSIVPSVQSAYGEAASAAARGGIDAFRSWASTNCPTLDVECSPPAGPTSIDDPTSDDGGDYHASYTLTASKGTGYIRVRSTGTVTKGGVSATRTLVADLTTGASVNVLDYSAVTGYETQAPDVVAQQFPARTIAFDSTAPAGYPAGSQVVWTKGAATDGSAGSVNVCNSLYGGANGRAHNPPPGAGSPYVDWSELGTYAGAPVTDYQPCQVSLGHSTVLDAVDPSAVADGKGGYASHDAVLLSNSVPGGSGPLLNQPVTTGYRYDPATAIPCDTAGQDYRSFDLRCAGFPVEVGGRPRTGSAYAPQHNDTIPSLPTAAPVIPAKSCVYSGPTRVRLDKNTGTATITSPLTTTRPADTWSGCYPTSLTAGITTWTTPNLSDPGFSGVFSVLDKGTASAGAANPHSPTNWNLTGQKVKNADGTPAVAKPANTVFYKDSGALPTAPVDPTGSQAADTCTTAYSAAAGSTCAWTNLKTATDGGGWTTYTPGTGCSSSLASTDRLAFECDFNNSSVGTPHDYYGIFRDRVKIDLSRSTCLTGTVTAQQTCLQTFLTNELNPANNSNHRYVVTASTPDTASTSKTLSANTAPITGDPFFDSTSSPGTPTKESLNTTAFTFTVSRQINKCYGLIVLGACLLGGSVIGTQWGSDTTAGASTPQFKATMTNQTATLSSAGSVGVSSFPYMADVTQYAVGSSGANGANGPGDLYVEGTTARTLSLVADNDAVITGSLGATGSAAVELAGRANVRVFHPVGCRSTDTTAIKNTAAGFCPNDITGLYDEAPATADRPDQQYVNLPASGSPTLSSLTIGAAVFALGQRKPTAGPCPQPAAGDPGVCSGEFSVDNYNRGNQLGSVVVTGTLAMQHHGPVGREWEIADRTGSSDRPYSGYQLTLRYQNLKGAINLTSDTGDVLGTRTTTMSSSGWHIVSISTGGK